MVLRSMGRSSWRCLARIPAPAQEPQGGQASYNRVMVRPSLLGLILVAMTAACGSSSPASPTVNAPIPAAQACAALGQTSGGLAILNGAVCDPARSPVVRLNMRDALGVPVGSCTGTIIGSRSILTAAHCVDA